MTGTGDHVPLIDVAALRRDAASTAAAETVAAMDAACTGTGFFVIAGHGVDGPVAGVFAAARAFFADRMYDPQCFLRLIHAPPRPRAGDETTGAHTDYGAITLLATDGVPGLEVRPLGGDWVPVEAPAGSLVVNLGDMLARWTNLRYASTPHRVVPVADEPRYSVPFFVNPDADTLVACIPSCVDAGHPCRFEPITAGAFLHGRIDGTIPTGDGTHR